MAMKLHETLTEQGFAIVARVFLPPDLDSISNLTDSWITLWQHEQVTDPDYWFYRDAETNVLYRIHNLEKKHNLIPQLVEYPAFKSLVQEVVGESAIPTAFALVIKMPGKTAGVPWHRDPVDAPPKTIFNCSIYLDESTPENGCLAAVPGSHLFDDMYVVAKERPHNALDLPAQAGDVIVHDVRLVHGSGASTSLQRRRSIIIEFRPAAWPRK